jgi:hypothetical protein
VVDVSKMSEQETEPPRTESEDVDSASPLQIIQNPAHNSDDGAAAAMRQTTGQLGGAFVAFVQSNRFVQAAAWLSRAALLVLLGAYLLSWLQGNWGMLTNPDLQNDDARTILFPFHAYGSADALGSDPIAQEMLSLVPWGVRSLYVLFVPIVDVYVASKLVQGVALLILLWAGVVLARSSRAGLGAAALLLFFVLHTPFASDRLGGGLPRAFGFPCFALWLAGVLAQKRLPRFIAPVLLALSYPSIMNLILAAEGFMALRGIGRVHWGVIGRRLRRYAALVGVCLVCVLPASLGESDRGPIHTLEQARNEPAFGRSGRLWILPFEKPLDAMSQAFIAPVKIREDSALKELHKVDDGGELIALLLIGAFLLLPFFRWVPPPSVAVSFFVGTTVIYAISRIFAFQLYSPERYYSFGMQMACLTLLLSCSAHLWFWLRPKWREIARNVSAAVLLGTVWLVSGSGIVKNSGMEINRGTDKELYEFVRTLPKDSRFATHILDGDGIPFWGARATMGSFETLQPWFTHSWARQKKRAMDTIDALYATEQEDIIRYADANQVTHFLINRSRYKSNLSRTAGSFQPFSDYAKEATRNKSQGDFPFSTPPKEAVIFESGRFSVVSVKELKKSWAQN